MMNQLIKRNNSLIAFRLFKSKFLNPESIAQKRLHSFGNSVNILRQTNCKFPKIGFNVNYNLLNRSENRKCYSTTVNIIMLGQFAPIIAMFAGLIIKRRWPQLSYLNRKSLLEMVSQNKFKAFLAISLMTGFLDLVYESCSEETPLTRRKRFVIFSKTDYEPICDILFKTIYNSYKNKILPNNHKTTKRIDRIVKRLLEANKGFEELENKEWDVLVIKEPNNANAFVLPTGKIIIYTGIIGMCDNDSQLGAILAHELSHAILGHGKEVISQEVLVDSIQSLVVFLLFLRFKAIKALVATVISGTALKGLLLLPKRRLIETEADFVGLVLTAKTCYDVREGSAFWRKMAALDDNKWSHKLSTHPSNTSRYENMDSYMESMIKLMESFNCPDLPKTDPRSQHKYSYGERKPIPKNP